MKFLLEFLLRSFTLLRLKSLSQSRVFLPGCKVSPVRQSTNQPRSQHEHRCSQVFGCGGGGGSIGVASILSGVHFLSQKS